MIATFALASGLGLLIRLALLTYLQGLVSCQAPSAAAHLPSPRRALLQALLMPRGMSRNSRRALHHDGCAVMLHLTVDATRGPGGAVSGMKLSVRLSGVGLASA